MFVVVVEDECVLNLYFDYVLFSSCTLIKEFITLFKNERMMKGSYQIGVT